MASAVAATSVSEILRPHRKTDSVAEREGFGPWVSPERVGPESSNENHRRYPGGPGVRISLPPAGNLVQTVIEAISVQARAGVANSRRAECRPHPPLCDRRRSRPVLRLYPRLGPYVIAGAAQH